MGKNHQTKIWPLVGLSLLLAQPLHALAAPKPAPLPLSEIPAKFTEPSDLMGFERRSVMIAMRDGVKLHTVILIPKGAKRAPILLTRTPYGADILSQNHQSTALGSVLHGYDNVTDVIVAGGYIRVIQDVRGKHGSEGDYVMNRPLQGPLNQTKVDHATDTYDTIDWLVKNLSQSNGKVGIIGISYDGFTPLMALVNPHPALKVSVPMNPMVDGWRDDWFHNGAFRQNSIDYVYEQEATRKSEVLWPFSHYDQYQAFLEAGSAGEVGRRYGMGQLGFWNRLTKHPAYDSFWQQLALDRILQAQPLKVPVLLVDSLFDQEDNYGAPAVYKALKPKDSAGNMVFMVMGPWSHGGELDDGSSLGAIKFDQDTAKQFRRDILAPFLAHYLSDTPPPLTLTSVSAFETGTNRWRGFDQWPVAKSKPVQRLYLEAGFTASLSAPTRDEGAMDEYVSDPAKPVTYRLPPMRPSYANDSTWSQWLTDDQRFAATRTDVLAYRTDVLKAPVTVSGDPMVNLVASTSGTDGDFVVKLIDVYPDEVPSDPKLGGYQMPVAMEIFRGRYREGPGKAVALTPDKPLTYRFALPTTNHVFLPGHRIMVQVQSSWFPLYDRNPQTFVDNIFFAKPSDYKKATIKLFRSASQPSYVELPNGKP
jgi:uncharacterized protein